MSLEEAKNILEEVKALDDSVYQYNQDYLEALNIAIKAIDIIIDANRISQIIIKK